MKKIYFAAALALLVGMSLALTSSSALAQEGIIDDTENSPTVVDSSGAWRLPFDGTMSISCAPGEAPDAQEGECKHIRWTTSSGTVIKDQAAIDYYNGTNFPVLAPADGVVFDTGFQDPGYGRWLRINHNGTFSFFAHLKEYASGISAGTPVKQGQQIGTSGRSGLPKSAGIHLHFDARVNVTQSGNTTNGNPTMTLALPGNWFNRWYSPKPDLRYDKSRSSGGAQYPEQRTRPSITYANARHLSNNQSPPNVLAGWTSNVTADQLALHFGARPNTPGNDYATTFQVYEWIQTNGDWTPVPGGPNLTAPAYTETIGDFNQADPNGQHSYLAYDVNSHDGQGIVPRYWEVWGGSSSSDAPPLSIIYRAGSDATVLHYCAGADSYTVHENHGGSSIFTYTGPNCSIQVHRTIGGINRYKVSAKYYNQWTPYTPWVTVRNE